MLGRLIQPELSDLIEKRDWRSLREVLLDLSVADIADVLAEIDVKDRAVAFRLLPRDRATEVFEHMGSDQREALLNSMRDVEAARILNDMSPDDRTELLEEMPDRVARRVMRLLTPAEREISQNLLFYPEYSVGRLMTPDYVKAKSHLTCGQVIDLLRQVGREKEAAYYIYVVNPDNVPLGVVTMREVVFSPPERRVSELLEGKEALVRVRADAEQDEAVRLITHYDLYALPVVDSRDRLVGIVTVDDLMDVQEEEATEDIQVMSGVLPTERGYLDARVRELLPKRVLSLLILAVTSTLTGLLLGWGQKQISKHEAVALFIIVAMAASGNTGGQAGTLVVRALAVERVETRDLGFLALREILMGALLALAVCVVVGLIGLVAFHVPWSAMLVIGGALVCAITLCNIFGAMLPIALRALGMDPAFFSTPIITTISDLVSLFTLFQFTHWFLDGSG